MIEKLMAKTIERKMILKGEIIEEEDMGGDPTLRIYSNEQPFLHLSDLGINDLILRRANYREGTKVEVTITYKVKPIK